MTTSGVIDSDGARLHFERRGDGPALLMIAGGGGDAARYSRTADWLAADFTVLTYDRRGCANSPIAGGGDARLRMEQQSADARAVIEHNGFGSASVFGSSGGALIGLDLTARCPAVVTALVAHEAPAITVLPDAVRYVSEYDEIDQALTDHGWEAAALKFLALNGMLPKSPAIRTARWLALACRLGSAADLAFFLTHEVRQFVEYEIDFDGLARSEVSLILAGGAQSNGHYDYRASQIIAERLGGRFAEFPGDHTGFTKCPRAFAARLAEVLRQ
jgi:pimeloyl-ACP methyl ester carboxylesterase